MNNNKQRERLMELLDCIKCNAESCSATENGRCGDLDNLDRCQIEAISDAIIADGWFRPPCKVGDSFYGLNETSYDEYEVLGFKFGKRRGDDEDVLIVLTIYDMEFVWGEEAFFTKEEVEKALSQ